MPKIHADCAFHIGSQHLRNGLPCQDYAIAGDLPDRAYAVVSDGCSSGGRTDVGARLISLAAAKAFRSQNIDIGHFVYGIDSASAFFDLNQSDMLATLLSMSVTQDEVFIRVQGDGVVSGCESFDRGGAAGPELLPGERVAAGVGEH